MPAPALYAELTKARLSAMVLLTTLAGYLLGARGHVDGARLLWTLLGTGACALGANALNQCLEVERDARMERTRNRPLPSERMSRAHAALAGNLLGAGGFLILLRGATALAAGLALFTLLLYVLIYTPLKPRSSLNTLVGAITGALPPVIGWTAAGRGIDGGAWLLFALLFLWQVPHFLALAWLYREDYLRGGFRMISTEDPSGRLTGLLVVVYSLALLPLAFALPLAGLAGPLFSAGFLILGLGLLLLGLSLRRRRDAVSARRLFLASVIQLPLILALLLFDPSVAAVERTEHWGPARRAERDIPVRVQGAAVPASERSESAP